MEFKPIETYYNNQLFRSRQEARWAVLFDEVEIEWKYEVEGFELPPYEFDKDAFINKHLSEGEIKGVELLKGLADYVSEQASKHIRYLPDFWFPGLNAWGEVKSPYTFENDFFKNYEKMMRLVNYQKQPIIMFVDFDKPIILAFPSDKMGFMDFGEIDLIKDAIRWDFATKKAKSYRFEFN